MASVPTVRVYRPDLTVGETELCRRLQALAELELDRLRDRTGGQERSAIHTTLGNGLARVTAGRVDVQDLPLAAAALARGATLTVILIPAPAALPGGT